MPAINFPDTPNINDLFTVGDQNWRWNGEYWVLIATPGTPGANGADGADALWNYLGEYDNGYDYQIGDVVTYNGELWYRSGEPNTGYAPGPGSAYWDLLAASGEGVPIGGIMGQVLAKSSSTDYDTQWIDVSTSLSGLTDVSFGPTVNDKDILQYDVISGVWVNGPAPITSTIDGGDPSSLYTGDAIDGGDVSSF